MKSFAMAWAGFALSAAMAQAQTADLSYSIVIPQGDATLVGGSEFRSKTGVASFSTYSLAVARVSGARGLLDLSWGDGGWAHIPIWGEYDFLKGLALQPDGKILVLGVAPDPAEYDQYPAFRDHFYLGVIRLNKDGTIDTSFNGTGRLIFHVGEAVKGVGDDASIWPSGIEVREDGKIVVFSTDAAGMRRDTARVDPDGTLDASFPASAQTRPREIEFVVILEYVNLRDQYFLASNTEELVLLDSGTSPGWHRTGYSFHAFRSAVAAPAGVPVCRLYGKPEFGLGNHFFTADPHECAVLADDPNHAWILESTEAFRVEIPDPTTGACARDRVPIFRLLAPRRDSAHRYTTSWEARAAAVYERWIAEGFGVNHVAMCGAP